jgi:hypothetical protein
MLKPDPQRDHLGDAVSAVEKFRFAASTVGKLAMAARFLRHQRKVRREATSASPPRQRKKYVLPIVKFRTARTRLLRSIKTAASPPRSSTWRLPRV